MAGEKEIDDLELDLELDVAYNEFDDEFQETEQQTTKHQQNQDCGGTNLTKTTEIIPNELHVSETSKNEIFSNQQSFEKVRSKGVKLSQLEQADSEEGELKSEDDFYLESVSKAQGAVQDGLTQNSKLVPDVLPKEGETNLTSDLIAGDEGLAMDIDEDQLLESEDEAPCTVEIVAQEKKNSMGNEDQVMKVLQRTRGGRKKKKDKKLKSLKLRLQNERRVHPKIGRLFKPLIATEDDSAEFLAKQLADRLEEEKDGLILRVVNILGHKKAIEIFEETKKIQIEGGVFTSDNYRRRTSGGIYLNIMKTRGYATKEQMKEIYAEEKEKEKQLVKERLRKQKELDERQMHDLRELLMKKKQRLLELENGNKVDT